MEEGTRKRRARKKESELTIIQQLRIWGFWRRVLAEFIGSFFYVLIVCETLMSLRVTYSEKHNHNIVVERLPTDLAYGGITGLSAMALSWILSDVSGGHVNPAVTAAMCVTRRVSLHQAICYVLGQCSGAVAASATLYGLTNNTHVGVTVIHKNLSSGGAIGVEALITFLYVFSFFSAIDRRRKPVPGGSLIAFGSAVTVAATFGVAFTGSSFNPARSLGPAVIERHWERHWVYWAGPAVGGLLGGILYDLVFAGNASIRRAKSFVSNPKYDPDGVEPMDQFQDNLSTNLSQKLRDIEEDERYFDQRQQEFLNDSDPDSLYLATFKDISDPVSRQDSHETLEIFEREQIPSV